TAVEDYCEPSTLPLLRTYRDEVLLKHKSGRLFVKFYYKIGPNLARILLRTPDGFQRKVAQFFDRISKKVSEE
ncbi:CFI-box-CTERM domain-containing protein, partial [Klebsiella pneumoniae]